MVLAAANCNGILLDGAQTWERLPGIGNLRLGASYQIHTATGCSGNAAHMLEQIQSGTFPLQKGFGAAGHCGKNIPLAHLFSIMHQNLHLTGSANQFKYPFGNVNSAENAVILCNIVCFADMIVI